MHRAIKVFMYSFILLGSYSRSMFNDTDQLDNDTPEEDIDYNRRDIEAESTILHLPRTKWCSFAFKGDGYDDGYNDLGNPEMLAKCCRNHDNCPDHILAKKTKHNLTNDAFYTRSSCECDETFRSCLRNAGSVRIGYQYFNGLGIKCYRKDYVVTGCKTYRISAFEKCLEPIYDKDSKPVYQWFDVRNY